MANGATNPCFRNIRFGAIIFLIATALGFVPAPILAADQGRQAHHLSS
jgi:hypothetical protein